ncbi:hypothetical protein WA026_023562 [Henosepilachna vigintioctopunctata]|uniref:Caspase-3 n=1 Tax=Henosepilachna vigintioctopunctata TaxID=420089 RepID=A0AAW1VG69_9CUCU
MANAEVDISTLKRGNEDLPDGNFPSGSGIKEKQRLNNDYRNSVSKIDDEFYSMNYTYNGYLLVFAHEFFEYGALERRPKAEEDIEMLKESFGRLNFVISVEKNRKFREIKKIIEMESQKNFDEYATFAVAISSHGSSNGIAARDAEYNLEDIIEPFKKTQSLIGKPKMFFVGCCRGMLVDNGVSISQDCIQTDGCQVEEYTIPVEADVIIVYATVNGYISYHNNENGSQFFIYLTEALNDYADSKDMLTVLTKANQQLAISFSSRNKDPEKAKKKQCMCFLSTLTRLLKFKVKAEEQA